MKAFAWQSGLIEFASEVPAGALHIASGPEKDLRRVVGAWARHGRQCEQLLVPGIPEADTEDAKLDVLIAFSARVRDRMAALRLA